ncbi:MAG: transcriptional regulator [Rhodobacteraceae bacterium]|nr:MAG: transcriptional regulator [Paracoccaceae bacterium]
MELLNHIKELRKKRTMTQGDLATAAGVSRKTINTIENSVFIPSTVLALKLARELGVTVHDIFELKKD